MAGYRATRSIVLGAGLAGEPTAYYLAEDGHGVTVMCCGSGEVVADLVAGRKPDIDVTGLPYAA